MSRRTKHVIVAYDITSNKRRKQAADFLLDAGLMRVNKSVFEGELREKEYENIFVNLYRLIRGHDRIVLYTVSGSIIQCKRILTRKKLDSDEGGARIL